jgi:nucleoid DNA-binding protein
MFSLAAMSLTALRGAQSLAPLARPAAARALSTVRRPGAARADLSRADLVKIVQEKAGLSAAQAKSAVDGVLDTVVNSVAKGEKVSLFGFGTFERAARAARTARNPKTGMPIEVPAKSVPKFGAAKAFKDTVAGVAP